MPAGPAVPAHSDLRVLLLQIRGTESVRREELESFARYSGLDQDQIDVLDAFATPDFEPAVVRNYNALWVGGASEASVLEPKTYPFVNNAINLLKYSADSEIPVFASCFGFQLAVLAFGGTIVRDAGEFEMGTPPISLTAASKSDPLFKDTSDGFHAVSVHRERAPSLPANCELLAYTDACPHAFRVKGKNFWAFQFHPEVDRATLIERLTVYKTSYTEGDTHLDSVLNAAQDTPESNDLLRKFVSRVLLEQHTA